MDSFAERRCLRSRRDDMPFAVGVATPTHEGRAAVAECRRYVLLSMASQSIMTLAPSMRGRAPQAGNDARRVPVIRVRLPSAAQDARMKCGTWPTGLTLATASDNKIISPGHRLKTALAAEWRSTGGCHSSITQARSCLQLRT